MDSIPPPDGIGWKLQSGELYIDWTDESAAPDVVLEFMSCPCKKGCEKENCSCASNGLPCTDMCKCKNCSNVIQVEDIINIINDEEDVDDYDDDTDEEFEDI